MVEKTESEDVGCKNGKKTEVMISGIRQMMEQRRKYKNKEIGRKIQRKVKKAKEVWENAKSEEIEQLEKKMIISLNTKELKK